MTTAGQHLIMDLWYDKNTLIEIIADNIANLIDEIFTVVERVEHQFSPQGRTIVYILSESHFTIHTYPEHNYLSLDLYICNSKPSLNTIKEKILQIHSPITYKTHLMPRGV